MSAKFIFSTKSVKDSNKFVFFKSVQLQANSNILEYRVERLKINTNDVLDYLNQLNEVDYNAYLTRNNIQVSDKANKKRVAQTISSNSNYKRIFAITKYPDLALYYVPDNNNSNNVFAVKCLEGGADVNWINALINDSTLGSQLSPADTLYLILHDKDVPGYEGEIFKILSSDEIAQIENHSDGKKVDGDLNNGKWIYNGYEIRIVVFNHVKNAITNILNKEKTGSVNVAKKVESVFKNKDILDNIFSNPPTKIFSGLDVDGFVDLMNNYVSNQIVTEKLASGRECYVYKDDNGALLTELMHVRTDAKSSKQFVEFVKELQRRYEEKKKNANKNVIKYPPVIVKIYMSFFDDWRKVYQDPYKKDKILNHPNKKAMQVNLERVFSFFYNSSIWVRMVDIESDKDLNDAIADFNYFDSIGLYDYASAWENLEYNLRFFSQNYLESALDGHGNFVTPVLYGNETVFREILIKNSQELKDIQDGK